MRKLLAVYIGVVGLGCGGVNSMEPGAGDDANDPMICVGDPDGQVICKKSSEFWDCTQLPNGDRKCVHQEAQQPGGGGSWSCTEAGDKIVCTTEAPNASAPGGGGWTCTSAGGTTRCEKEAPLPPGGGDWDCTLQEFTWTCEVSDAGTGGSGSSASTGGSGSSAGTGGSGSGAGTGGSGSGVGTGGSGGSTSGPIVCTHWYAVKWGIGGNAAGSCEAIPNNLQDCDSIRDLLGEGLPGPFTNGTCTVAPVRVGSDWVLTLPARCQFLQGGVCGKYGGNDFATATGSSTVTLPAQRSTGLSHFEAMWCCE